MAEGVYGFVLAVELVHAEQAPSEAPSEAPSLAAVHTLAAMMLPDWAFLPTSRFVLAVSTDTGACILTSTHRSLAEGRFLVSVQALIS